MGILDFLGGNVIEAVKDIADEFITTDEERLQYQIEKEKLRLKEKQIEANLLEKVHETNIAEAKTGNLFIAGWRPFIGWTGGIALFYHFVLAPFLHSFFNAFGVDFTLPTLDMGLLIQLILTMLGMAGLRTFEKYKGIQHRH
ncbi:Holin of 3TMs, for gene-transfer release [Persephonella hydrogeniphila]|uniref:Holin of 3TMs, for gene-transfer release n=1 Tax=Persephonella hydrogeniphila TaxID=198703 RepID=A0A285NQZ1_9AQUI|nr:3TM-type holin [Persephonella hydrogeniphila]SNZ11895.1 Holin of 3TMs, for gene-transfer release [Persephonella hydrogeniphila]